MTAEVIDLRKAERFTVVQPIDGTFGGSEMSVKNIGVTGLQIVHAHPMRIGTRARVVFRSGGVDVTTQAHLIWSHLSRTPDDSGKLLYVSGLHVDNAEPQYAAAINTLFRAGTVRPDTESMDRKRARALEREEARKSQMKVIPPTSGGMGT